MIKPKDSKSFMTIGTAFAAPTSEECKISISSKYMTSLLPSCLRRAIARRKILEKAQGAEDKLKGRDTNSNVHPPQQKRSYLRWSG